VPSSGAISIRNFYGTSNIVVDFFDRFIFTGGFGSSQAGYTIIGSTLGGLIAGNDYESTDFNFPSNPNQWITPTSQAANYQVYASYAGTPPSGTLNTWIATSGNPSWSIEVFGSGNSAITELSLQVRRTGTTTVLDVWSVTLEANAF
jgi:hypothetical protein